jgi:hypothetical protein
MKAVDYHFVYAAATLFWCDLIDALRMTGFNFGARGQRQAPVEIAERKIA